MEKDDDLQKELFMPSGLKLKKEIFPGFTKDEMKPTILSAVIFVMIDCILWMCGLKNFGVMFFIPMLGTPAVAFMYIKNELNLSPVDIIKMEIRFAREQKYYPYIAKDEWENIE